MNTKLTFIHALSPLHAGTGQGVGVIDLPIAREKATGIPYLPGSSLKGTLRDLCSHPRKEDVFGPSTVNASEYAGSAQFTDQRLLLLPIRSLKGTFAWVTSPYLLRRLIRDVQGADAKAVCPELPETSLSGKQYAVARDYCALLYQDTKDKRKKVILEDLDLDEDSGFDAVRWAEWIGQRIFQSDPDWQRMLKAKLCIVPDEVLDFLLITATEITARIRLGEKLKTVERGALWYEEALPAETVLSGLIVATEVKAKSEVVFQVIEDVLAQQSPIQLGGKATVGRGMCYVGVYPPSRQEQTGGAAQ